LEVSPGENGGGAFVIVYLLCVGLIGIPIMIAEIMIGRRGKQNPVDTINALVKEAGADKSWHYLGWMGVVAGFLILFYYSVIAGWASSYVVKAFIGSFSGAGSAEIKELFDNFIASPVQLWHTLFTGNHADCGSWHQ
jgi:NSS family neurotransmitter:Na+ symporter